MSNLNSGWNDFLIFGKELLLKYSNPSPESLKEGSRMIREVCPIKAANWMVNAEKLLEYQQNKTDLSISKSISKRDTILTFSTLSILVSSIVAIVLGYFFSLSVFRQISSVTKNLQETVKNVTSSSEIIMGSSHNLSNASNQTTSSLEDNVTSINEISAMTKRNSESANKSTAISKTSDQVAREGKINVDKMIKYVSDISTSNKEIAKEVQKNNEDISKIVVLISEIGEKTRVINEIVFQTKLLSFNASVEAARAGEHGKGFAVVAEEVGNLASMSGSAATEITQMLDDSTQQVTNIIQQAKNKIQLLVTDSQEKVDKGIAGAQACGTSLDEILKNVESLNNVVNEITVASDEQAKGVDVVTKSMQRLDKTTVENSLIAEKSIDIAEKLENQAINLNGTISQLTLIISGETDDELTKVAS